MWLGLYIDYSVQFVSSSLCAAAAKSLQSCPTLWVPIDGSPPGSPIPGILQARTLEWLAISFSNAWKGKVKVKSLSRVWLLVTPWTAANQPPPSMGFSRQEDWSGLPLPSPLGKLTWCLFHPYGSFLLWVLSESDIPFSLDIWPIFAWYISPCVLAFSFSVFHCYIVLPENSIELGVIVFCFNLIWSCLLDVKNSPVFIVTIDISGFVSFNLSLFPL